MPLSAATIERHRRMARELVEETHRHHGLAPVDLARFWADRGAYPLPGWRELRN